jgi:lysozyme family protein
MNFDQAFDRLIGHEGGYVNDPNDPGGETNWGISKRSYPDVDIKNLTKEGAKAIYYRDFWAPLGNTPDAVKFQAFDFAVNSGIQTAVRKLQSAVGAVDDGVWGPMSASRLNGMDLSDVLMLFLAERLEFMTKLKNWKFHGSGWANRVATNLRYAVKDN